MQAACTASLRLAALGSHQNMWQGVVSRDILEDIMESPTLPRGEGGSHWVVPSVDEQRLVKDVLGLLLAETRGHCYLGGLGLLLVPLLFFLSGVLVREVVLVPILTDVAVVVLVLVVLGYFPQLVLAFFNPLGIVASGLLVTPEAAVIQLVLQLFVLFLFVHNVWHNFIIMATHVNFPCNGADGARGGEIC
ncbi:hypothetical protein EYF80_026788 [Liparis tanakae]|uniref:Uncharacterized protein n=1 Tax=Liparis tanakae TaxID=230148 RepID=A0A4Z2HAY9_9TELE|nr:hypothetical protein EYF80_026788 [Liparis tanakae]